MTIDEARNMAKFYESTESAVGTELEELARLTLKLLDVYESRGRGCTSGACGICAECASRAAVEKALEERTPTR